MPIEITMTPCAAGRQLRYTTWTGKCPRHGTHMVITDEGTLLLCAEHFEFVTAILAMPES